MKFDVIVSDPPWAFGDTLKKMKSKTRRSAQSQYGTMSIDEIKAIDVPSITEQGGAILALWVPGSFVQHGLEVLDAWGFTLKQTFVWVKTKKDIDIKIAKKLEKEEDSVVDLNDTLSFGMGHLFRQCHEIALIATCGDGLYKKLENKSQRSVMLEHNQGHSIKPDMLQDRLDIMFPSCDKLEMFARRTRPGWTVIGDGVTSKDINESIQELSAL